jgi:hypothetical protein
MMACNPRLFRTFLLDCPPMPTLGAATAAFVTAEKRVHASASEAICPKRWAVSHS